MSHYEELDFEQVFALIDYEPMEINGIDDLIFEYESDQDLEQEILSYRNLIGY